MVGFADRDFASAFDQSGGTGGGSLPPYLAASSDEFALAAVMASPSPETSVAGDIRGAWVCLNHIVRGIGDLGRRFFVVWLSAKRLYGSAKRRVALRARLGVQE